MPQAINPATEEIIADHPDHDDDHIAQALHCSQEAFSHWRQTTFEQRAEVVRRAGEILRGRRTELATLMTREMGKPITAAEAEIDKCAGCCEYFANNAPRLLADEEIATDATRSYVRYEPLGPILAIMPWNFPFWQVFRFAAPALMAGNVALLKHASNVPACALAIERIIAEAAQHAAALPAPLPSLLATLLISSDQANTLIADPTIRAVTLTGSERAGQAVGAAAGRALKKVVLELGGSDPFIILDDADIPSVAAAAASARCINSGQSCIAAKRFIVLESIAEPFEEAFAAAMQSQRMGDPMNRATQIGPLAREDLRASLHDQVQRTIKAGARLLTGGRIPPGKGFFYPPTILADVTPGMPAFDEETFGPVATITRARDVDHAIELANASPYGLGASLWTANAALAEKIAPQLDCGNVFINGPVKSDPRLPFGGTKNSGHGRELAEVGIREFVNIKTVWVKAAQGPDEHRRTPIQR